MEKIKVNAEEIPMMKYTEASLTLISKKQWKHIGQREFEEKNTGLQTYDNHKMKCNNKVLKVNIAVVGADSNFGLLGRDIINHS